jgi:hypothetical protein
LAFEVVGQAFVRGFGYALGATSRRHAILYHFGPFAYIPFDGSDAGVRVHPFRGEDSGEGELSAHIGGRGLACLSRAKSRSIALHGGPP